jgi:tetratricopeptide (TPR) repeat protein
LIINDLKTAAPLLPDQQELKTRPSKCAAWGMLARVYLSMSNYDSAFHYANLALGIYSTLYDYNDIPDITSLFTFTMYGPEVIFHSRLANINMILPIPITSGLVDTVLLNSYHEDDLRKTAFFIDFNGGIKYKGTYDGFPGFLFNGIATDELYLIRAESAARKGELTKALDDLNKLLKSRWNKAAVFTPVILTSKNALVELIKIERRKELCFRGLRFSDLRRYNLQPDEQVTITRKVNNLSFTLPANDNRYVLPIPASEIDHNPVPQNQR